MFRLVIPILKHTENTEQLDSVDLEINYNDCDVFEGIFYSVNLIIPVFNNGRNWTEIFTNGTSFISPLQLGEVDKLIKKEHLKTFILS